MLADILPARDRELPSFELLRTRSSPALRAFLEGENHLYDFGVWEMNELARQLEADGMVAEAAAMLALNEEFHVRDASIPRTLGPLYETLGRRDAAVAAYRRALGLNPADTRSLERLRALDAG